jgi:hypothetical protein
VYCTQSIPNCTQQQSADSKKGLRKKKIEGPCKIRSTTYRYIKLQLTVSGAQTRQVTKNVAFLWLPKLRVYKFTE